MVDKIIKTGSDFSGVGAFDQALNRLNIKQDKIFACDMDKYSRISYIENYGEPDYYPENVYDRKIPEESLDVYMTSPPCQAFSIAGKRKGENDDRGVLFYNSHEFISKNKPRYFIFENVKGLLSHDKRNKKAKYGNTFSKWIEMLGGKSVNGNMTLFPFTDSVPYHIYWTVLNSKDFNIPQNRERVFIVGIRDDDDNVFKWPKSVELNKTIKDVIDFHVDEKYFLSYKMISYLRSNSIKQRNNNNGFKYTELSINDILKSITTKEGHRMDDNFIKILNTRPKSYRIRRLTSRECFRSMDFPETYKIVVSDTQAYKQAGNSIAVGVLSSIISCLKL